MNLVAIISQRLIPAKDKGKRVLAAEVLTPTPYMQSLIQQGELDKIKQAMEESSDKHLQTFDQSLFKLYAAGKITIEEALHNADSPSDLKLKIRLSGGGDPTEEHPKFSSVQF